MIPLHTNLEAPMTSTSVRISKPTHVVLKDLAAREDRSQSDILDEAITQYRERQFWQDARVAYNRLREDPDAWQAYKDELAEWDIALLDVLEVDEWQQTK
jgi:predicted DNA-binding protein